ncbi:MAG: amidophosphoribosyltransferase, partial [Chitinivibrionales bacterium]
MGGFFGVVSREDCITDLFYGTDYHCHLGTRRGGLAVANGDGIKRVIHDITNTQFRSKFDSDISRLHGRKGIGVISDYEDQPLIIGSHLGTYGIVTVGVINNAEQLTRQAFSIRTTHFSEMSGNCINSTEIIATLINQEESFESGIQNALSSIDGSCSLLLLTRDGMYAARDLWGRTPVIIGKNGTGYCA